MERYGFSPSLTIKIALNIPHIDAIDATDKSIPPVSSTMVCPNPTRITKAAALVRVLILYEVKKLPVAR